MAPEISCLVLVSPPNISVIINLNTVNYRSILQLIKLSCRLQLFPALYVGIKSCTNSKKRVRMGSTISGIRLSGSKAVSSTVSSRRAPGCPTGPVVAYVHPICTLCNKFVNEVESAKFDHQIKRYYPNNTIVLKFKLKLGRNKASSGTTHPLNQKLTWVVK